METPRGPHESDAPQQAADQDDGADFFPAGAPGAERHDSSANISRGVR